MSHWQRPGRSNEWYTPKLVFDAMGCTFDLDVAAPPAGPRHVPCLRWLYANSLTTDWAGFVWMNPPFGGRNGLVPWIVRFVKHGNGVALVPDRTSAPWWQYFAARVDAVLFTAAKLKFERPDGTVGKQPGDGTALMAIGQRGCEALRRAHHEGLGFLMRGQP